MFLFNPPSLLYKPVQPFPSSAKRLLRISVNLPYFPCPPLILTFYNMSENLRVLRHVQNNFPPLEFSPAPLHASCTVKIQLLVLSYFHSPSSDCVGRKDLTDRD